MVVEEEEVVEEEVAYTGSQALWSAVVRAAELTSERAEAVGGADVPALRAWDVGPHTYRKPQESSGLLPVANRPTCTAMRASGRTPSGRRGCCSTRATLRSRDDTRKTGESLYCGVWVGHLAHGMGHAWDDVVWSDALVPSLCIRVGESLVTVQ